MTAKAKTLVAGCDLGKASAGFVICERSGDGKLSLLESEYVLHEGRPFEAFRRWSRAR